MSDPALWVALASVGINFMVIVLTSQHYAIKNAETRQQELTKLELAMRDYADVATRRFGETILAAREKAAQAELWNRDNFIDKTTFNIAVGDIKETSRRLEEKIDRNFKDLDRKLEKIANSDGH